MAISDRFFERMKSFQDTRAAIIERYEKRMESLKSAAGSLYYDQESKKAAEQKDKELEALKREKGADLFNTLDVMQLASDGRKETPPTDEQLKILQATTSLKNVDPEYLDTIANTLKESDLCLSVLDDFAAANGIRRDYRSMSKNHKMSIGNTTAAIQALRKAVDDFIDTDRNKSIERIMQSRADRYGNTGDMVPKREIFTDNNSMYEVIAPWMNQESISAFMAAIDS